MQISIRTPFNGFFIIPTAFLGFTSLRRMWIVALGCRHSLFERNHNLLLLTVYNIINLKLLFEPFNGLRVRLFAVHHTRCDWIIIFVSFVHSFLCHFRFHSEQMLKVNEWWMTEYTWLHCTLLFSDWGRTVINSHW